ncbi:MAG: PA2779 family protein [Candidatus Omnitrophica bacterium]|nr:PA2779 family protein [Candidatus Omnitrophota bacterium]
MTTQRLLNPRLAALMAGWALLMGVSPGRAFAMPTGSLVALQTASDRDARIEKIMGILSRPAAQIHLRAAGISQAQLREGLSKLDDDQLAAVARRAEVVKAGGELGIIIALLVVAILVIIVIQLLDKDIEIKDKKK